MTYENFVQVQLAAPLGSSDTSLTLANPTGAYRLPPATGGILVLADSVGSPAFTEIVSYVSRSGNTLSGLTRGQEGTSARAWPAGTFCYQSLTAGDFANALGLKAPLASPAFTGNPTAPTPAATDNDTSIATTAHVKEAMALFGVGAEREYGGDLNDLTTPGLYSVMATSPNWPLGNNGGTLLVLMHGGGAYASQLAFSVTDSRVIKRAKVGTSWSAWQHVWTSESLVKQTSLTDTTPGAVLTVGAFGLGTDGVPPRNDLNALTTAGMYQFNNPTSGFPGFNYGAVLVLARATSEVVQIAWDITSETQVSRKLIGGTWSPWQAAYHTGNQLSLGTTPAAAQTALELVKGTSPGNVLVAGAELVGRHTVECFVFLDTGSVPGATIYTNIPASESVMPNLIIRGALNGYTEPFEARLSWYFYGGTVYLPNVLITATGGVSGVRFYLRPENGKIVIRIDFGGSVYISRLAFDALRIPGGYNPDPSALQGWSAVASNAVGSSEVEALRSLTYHSRNILGTVSQSGGVPTGAIIERGSNANGEYVRFADGTQICFVYKVKAAAASMQANGVHYWSDPWPFPAAFISAPSITTGAFVAGVLSWGSADGQSIDGTLGYLNAFANIAATADVHYRAIAIGRWY